MAGKRDIGARVTLEGEQQFKKAMKGASDAIKVLNSEQKLAQAQFEATGNKEQFMADKADILRRKIEEQQKAVNAAQEAVNKLKEQGVDPTNKAMQDWTTKLNTAKAYLTRLEGQLNSTESELEGQGDAFDDASAAAADYNDELQNIGKGIDFQNVTAILDSMHQRLEKALEMVTSVSTAIYNAVTDAGKWADDIATESQIAGLDVETYQSWLYASRFIDTNVSDIISARQRLLKNLASDNEETVKLFNSLGVVTRQTNGDLRNYGDVFWDVIDALGGIENTTQRDAAAMDILGKSAQELNPLIMQGSAALRDLAAEAEATGYVLDESQLKKLGEVDDAYQELQLQIQATKQQLAVEFAPTSKEVLEGFAKLAKGAGDALTQSGLVKGVGELVQFSTALLQPLSALVGVNKDVSDSLQPLYIVLHSVAGMFAWVADTANATIGILQTFFGIFNGTSAQGFQRFNTAIGQNAKYGMYSNMQRWDGTASTMEAIRSGYAGNGSYNTKDYGYDAETGRYYDRETGNYIYGYNASGNSNWRGGMTYLAENGPEAVFLPAGSRIMNAQETRQAMGGDTFYITIDPKNVKEFNDIVEIARSARVLSRMKGG